MRPPIRIHTSGGLGNRLQGLLSMLAVAAELGRPLICHWPLNPQCGARFEDLFEPLPPGCPLIEWNHDHALPGQMVDWYTGPDLRRGLEHPDVVGRVRNWIGFDLFPGTVFFERLRLIGQSLRGRPEVLALVPPASGERLGIHIRCTDHFVARMSAPPWFWQDVCAALGAAGIRAAVLCTDDADLGRSLLDRHRAWLQPGPGLQPADRDQDPLQTYRVALADLLTLRSSCAILASPGSTFSETAAWWGERPRLVATWSEIWLKPKSTGLMWDLIGARARPDSNRPGRWMPYHPPVRTWGSRARGFAAAQAATVLLSSPVQSLLAAIVRPLVRSRVRAVVARTAEQARAALASP